MLCRLLSCPFLVHAKGFIGIIIRRSADIWKIAFQRTMAGIWHNPLRSAGKGTRVASILAGHRLFVRGSPTRFDDSLSAHFLFVESTLKPISMGLRFAPYFYRSLHAESLRDENKLRKAALAFWSHERWYASITNGVAVRLLLLVYRGAWTLFWVPAAFLYPSFTHRVLQHGNDIMLQKYLAIRDGAPLALQRDIADRLSTFISFHNHAAELTDQPDPNVISTLTVVWIYSVLVSLFYLYLLFTLNSP